MKPVVCRFKSVTLMLIDPSYNVLDFSLFFPCLSSNSYRCQTFGLI